jgi:hypothetical protein
VFVGYSRLLEDPALVCEQLGGFLERRERAEDPAVRAQVESWIEPSLRHHTTPLLELLSDERIDQLDLSLAFLLELAGRRNSAATPREDAVDEALNAVACQLLERTDTTTVPTS